MGVCIRIINLIVIGLLLISLGCGGRDEGNDGSSDGGGDTATGSDSDTATGSDTQKDTDTDSESEYDTESESTSETSSDTASDTESDSETDVIDKSGCKRGVAYGHHSKADMSVLSGALSWWYNWYFEPESEVLDSYKSLNMEFVPMIWGSGTDLDQALASIDSDAEYLLGFNEPNFFAQANLSATQAAALWLGLEALAEQKGLQLVSPAVNFCGGGCHDTDPVAYLRDFFAACEGCRVDAIAIHIYVECDENDPGLSENRAQWLINHVEMYKNAFEKPLWLTEFACSGNPTVAEQIAFMEDAVAYLENEPRIIRYAWFAGRADNMVNVDLLGESGELTELGYTYTSLAQNPECDLTKL